MVLINVVLLAKKVAVWGQDIMKIKIRKSISSVSCELNLNTGNPKSSSPWSLIHVPHYDF